MVPQGESNTRSMPRRCRHARHHCPGNRLASTPAARAFLTAIWPTWTRAPARPWSSSTATPPRPISGATSSRRWPGTTVAWLPISSAWGSPGGAPPGPTASAIMPGISTPGSTPSVWTSRSPWLSTTGARPSGSTGRTAIPSDCAPWPTWKRSCGRCRGATGPRPAARSSRPCAPRPARKWWSGRTCSWSASCRPACYAASPRPRWPCTESPTGRRASRAGPRSRGPARSPSTASRPMWSTWWPRTPAVWPRPACPSSSSMRIRAPSPGGRPAGVLPHLAQPAGGHRGRPPLRPGGLFRRDRPGRRRLPGPGPVASHGDWRRAARVSEAARELRPQPLGRRANCSPERDLEAILSIAYQASVLRDEDRPVAFRLVLAPAEAFAEDSGPPTGVLALRFEAPRRFDEHELRRLSQAAKYHRTLIGVGATPNDQFVIWGVVQTGPRWLPSARAGEEHRRGFPDGALVVRVPAPGRIEVARGLATIAEMRGGLITEPGLDVFESRWLAARFAGIRDEVVALHRASFPDDEPPPRRLDQEADCAGSVKTSCGAPSRSCARRATAAPCSSCRPKRPIPGACPPISRSSTASARGRRAAVIARRSSISCARWPPNGPKRDRTWPSRTRRSSRSVS